MNIWMEIPLVAVVTTELTQRVVQVLNGDGSTSPLGWLWACGYWGEETQNNLNRLSKT